MRVALVVAVSLAAATAAAAPLTIRHGRAIHVEIGAKTEEAIALRAVAGGWRLELAAASNSTLVLRDVTAGASPMRFDLPVVASAVTLDDTRFRADHAYRVELRRGTAVIGSALIYLSPPRRSRGPVMFDDAEATRPDDDRGELRPSDKGTL